MTTGIDAPGFDHLKSLVRLRHLELDTTGVTDAWVLGVDRFTELTTLTLGSTKVTDRALSSIGRLRHLEVLDLSRTAVTDDGIDGSARTCFGTNVTVQGLIALCTSTSLREVIVYDQMPDDDLELLRQHVSDVHYDPGF